MKTTKIYTVTATVSHGDFNHTEIAAACGIANALNVILLTPMGRGYAPDKGTKNFIQLVSDLENHGKGAFGWGDYTLDIRDKPTLAAVAPVCPDSWIVDECPDAGGFQTIRIADGSKNGDTDQEPIATVYSPNNAGLIAASPVLFAENIKLKAELLASLKPEAVKLVGSRIAELEKQNAGLLAELENAQEWLEGDLSHATMNGGETTLDDQIIGARLDNIRAAIASAKGVQS